MCDTIVYLLTEIPIGHICLMLHELNKITSDKQQDTVKQQVCSKVDTTKSFLDLYKYESPMEKQLNKVLDQISKNRGGNKTTKT